MKSFTPITLFNHGITTKVCIFYLSFIFTKWELQPRYVSFIFYFCKVGGEGWRCSGQVLPGYSRLSFSTMIEILQIICGLVDLVDLRIVLGRLVFLVHLSSRAGGRYIFCIAIHPDAAILPGIAILLASTILPDVAILPAGTIVPDVEILPNVINPPRGRNHSSHDDPP